MNAEPIIYRLDPEDRISHVEGPWDGFANANGGPKAKVVLGRPIWDFVTDPTVRQLFREALSRAREGRTVRFPFRCDSPKLRRSLALQMALRPAGDGTLELRSDTERVEERPAVRLLSSDALRDEREVKMCSWCKRIMVVADWVDVENGVTRLRLFEGRTVPTLVHTACHDCVARMSKLLHEEQQPAVSATTSARMEQHARGRA